MIKEFYISSSSVDWISTDPSLFDHSVVVEALRRLVLFFSICCIYVTNMYKPDFCVCKYAQSNHYVFCLSDHHLG